jgi:nucleoside-diphosphate-sugar epimerase
MRVLVTGVDGYIGCVLAPFLMEKGHEVVGLDTGYYRDGWLYGAPRHFPVVPKILTKDLRQIDTRDLAGFDAVVHLAELSNDPLGANNPAITHAINHRGSVQLAELAKKVGVQRFIYTSSCSVYGLGTGDFLAEDAPVNPQTAYAQCKALVERDVVKLADEKFCPTFLRNATAYGASPRMRFDIVLNNLCGYAWTEKRIAMTSDGTPWRPLVHILDICQAISVALQVPRELVFNEIFNVGHNADNYQIREIARIVADVFPDCVLSVGPSGGDDRSYRVSFDKIHNKLSEFKCSWTARKGAEQLRELFERVAMSKETFEFRAFTRLKQLEFLIRTKQIDEDFYWRF